MARELPLEEAYYAEVLRALGRLGISLHAQAVEIETVATGMVVSWRHALKFESRHYSWAQLNVLRLAAQELRGAWGAADGLERADLLRTLGQELDLQRAVLGSLQAQAEGLQVHFLRQGIPIERRYSWVELRTRNAQRRAARSLHVGDTFPDDDD